MMIIFHHLNLRANNPITNKSWYCFVMQNTLCSHFAYNSSVHNERYPGLHDSVTAFVRRYIQKFPDWANNALRSNTKDYGGKTH
jgi:hypothetical protein